MESTQADFQASMELDDEHLERFLPTGPPDYEDRESYELDLDVQVGMIASQWTETEAGLEISIMAAGNQEQALANSLRVIDLVLLWAHDCLVLHPLSFFSRVPGSSPNERALRSRGFSREVARKKSTWRTTTVMNIRSKSFTRTELRN